MRSQTGLTSLQIQKKMSLLRKSYNDTKEVLKLNYYKLSEEERQSLRRTLFFYKNEYNSFVDSLQLKICFDE